MLSAGQRERSRLIYGAVFLAALLAVKHISLPKIPDEVKGT